jgi:hypothetical protein
MKILVSPAGYDDVGAVLTNMGKPYSRFNSCSLTDLGNPRLLAGYDYVFLNCIEELSAAPTMFSGVLDQYVKDGGVIYASDFAMSVAVEMTARRFTVSGGGHNQVMRVRVQDPFMAGQIGNEIDVNFDLDDWLKILKVPKSASLFLVGLAGEVIALGFRHGLGHVFVTSFHHHVQDQQTAQSMLARWLLLVPFALRHTSVGAHALSAVGASAIGSGVSTFGSRASLHVSTTYAPGARYALAGVWDSSSFPHTHVAISYRRGQKVVSQATSTVSPVTVLGPEPSPGDIVEVRTDSTHSEGESSELPLSVVWGERRSLVNSRHWLVQSVMAKLLRAAEGTDLERLAQSTNTTVVRRYLIQALETVGLRPIQSNENQMNHDDTLLLFESAIPGVTSPRVEFGVSVNYELQEAMIEQARPGHPREAELDTDQFWLGVSIGWTDITQEPPQGFESNTWNLVSADRVPLDLSGEDSVDAEVARKSWWLAVGLYQTRNV